MRDYEEAVVTKMVIRPKPESPDVIFYQFKGVWGLFNTNELRYGIDWEVFDLQEHYKNLI